MNTTGKEIGELLNTSGAAAPDITKPLKSIGNGNMLDGVRKIFNYALAEGEKTGLATGEKRGLAKGSMITLAACGALYLIPKGDALGEKIHAAFSEEVADRPGEEASTDEVLRTAMVQRRPRNERLYLQRMWLYLVYGRG